MNKSFIVMVAPILRYVNLGISKVLKLTYSQLDILPMNKRIQKEL